MHPMRDDESRYMKNRMENMEIKRIVLLVVVSAALAGCGGSSRQDSEVVLGDGYDEKSGDVFTTSSIINVDYSNGQTDEIISTDVDTYTQVGNIPNKYGYSNSNDGPFLLETNRSDGELDGLEYMTISGDFIINDDLDYFSSVEYTTQSGSAGPEDIHIGDKFSRNQNSTLFDSQTGEETGYDISNMDFVVIKEEKVTVPAGSFNAVKISYSISTTKSDNDIVNTLTGSGYAWFDTTNGFMLKLVIENGNMTLGEHNITASFSAETVLHNYSISQTVSTKRSKAYTVNNFTSLAGINPLIVFRNLNKSTQVLY